jgi:hypothetical protein
MTRALKPSAMIASMSFDCLVELGEPASWPSSSRNSMPPIISACCLAKFIMWTKNGKFSPGTEKASLIGSCAFAESWGRPRPPRRLPPPS